MAKSGLAERAFSLITAQIEKSGFVLKRGTLIDASSGRSAVNPPEPPDGALSPDPDGRPASKLVKSPHDPDATWTRKENKYFFGYKMHVGMDQDSRIIRRLDFTPANVNDTVVADALICGDEATVYADKAYDSQVRRARLKAMGIRDGIMRRNGRWHRLGAWAVRRNALESGIVALRWSHSLPCSSGSTVLRAPDIEACAVTPPHSQKLAAAAINLQRWARMTPQAT